MTKKSYTVIVKVGPEKFLKYRNIHSIDNFIQFLNRSWPDWRYANIYDKETRDQVRSITRKNKE